MPVLVLGVLVRGSLLHLVLDVVQREGDEMIDAREDDAPSKGHLGVHEEGCVGIHCVCCLCVGSYFVLFDLKRRKFGCSIASSMVVHRGVLISVPSVMCRQLSSGANLCRSNPCT